MTDSKDSKDSKDAKDSKEDKVVKELRTFMDDEGKEITGFFDFNKETFELIPEGVLYKGTFPVMTNMGALQMSCMFPDDYTLERCFEEFDKFAREAVEEKKKEISEQNKIIVPGQEKKIII